MKVAPDIIRHEFIGTQARVARSRHSGYVGISGEVVDETRNSFAILHQGKKKRVMKDSSFFHFRLSDGTLVEIDGRLLVGRPEDRLKKQIKRLW
ncbi:MAG: ribonuclease P protein component 1 [Candidatus Bathycorpusculaceae bacterium]